jgi:hypothetical protein
MFLNADDSAAVESRDEKPVRAQLAFVSSGEVAPLGGRLAVALLKWQIPF